MRRQRKPQAIHRRQLTRGVHRLAAGRLASMHNSTWVLVEDRKLECRPAKPRNLPVVELCATEVDEDAWQVKAKEERIRVTMKPRRIAGSLSHLPEIPWMP